MISLSTAFAQAAQAWGGSPEHLRRITATQATLSAPNQFTKEALEFAIDQQMSVITEPLLRDWIRGRKLRKIHRVGVINAGNVPLVGLQDLLAVLLCGHSYIGVLSSKSPYLLPAFIQTVRDQGIEVDAQFVDRIAVWEDPQALIATGSDTAIAQISAHARQNSVPSQKCLFRSNRYGVAVLDGHESDEDLDDLAMDILLHEGMGCRNVAVVFAPDGLKPDQCLKHLAQMRAVFPAHSSTPGRLAIQRAYLAAIDSPHAYGDGLEFLVSKGAPDAQGPGHTRWVAYEDIEDVIEIVNGLSGELQCIVAREECSRKLPSQWNTQPLGSTQTPAIDWKPDGMDTIEFLCNL